MKRIAITLLAAFVGGAVAIGGYKLTESKYATGASIDEKQKSYFASNPASTVSSTGNPDFVEASALVAPGVVHIKTKYERTASSGSDMDIFENFMGRGRSIPRQPAEASGSGVIVSGDGYIITNNHVVENATDVSVILTDRRTFTAKVVGRDPNTDLALLKVDSKNLPVVKIGNSDDVRVGEWVLAVGYPFSLESTVTAGIVSAKGRSIGILSSDQRSPFGRRNTAPDVTRMPVESFIQTDAVINRGNSGGALVNTNGELIGINSAIASQSGSYEGYGFAIPINLAKKVVDDIMKYGTVKRGVLGVSFPGENPVITAKFQNQEVNGLNIEGVAPNSGAAAAGIKPGDVIIKTDGVAVLSVNDLQERIARLSPGDKVKVTYLRNGKPGEALVTLKEQTKEALASLSANSSQIYESLGAALKPASAARKQQLKIASGMTVTGVNPDSMFGSNIPKGTVITKINGKPVNSEADVNAALKQSDNGMVTISGITPDNGRLTSTFPIE